MLADGGEAGCDGDGHGAGGVEGFLFEDLEGAEVEGLAVGEEGYGGVEDGGIAWEEEVGVGVEEGGDFFGFACGAEDVDSGCEVFGAGCCDGLDGGEELGSDVGLA